MADTEIRGWDGNPESAPQPFEKFLYKERQHIWVAVGQQNVVVDTDERMPNLALTVRLAPGKTGVAACDVLIKAGVAAPEEIASAIEEKSDIKLHQLMSRLKKLLYGIKDAEALRKWAKAKNISGEELMEVETGILAQTVMNSMFN